MIRTTPLRGDVWRVDFGNPIGRERRLARPALVISANRLNAGPAGVVIVVPLTSSERGLASHVAIHPPDGGLKRSSYAKTEDLRSVSAERLRKRIGSVSPGVIDSVVRSLRMLLELP